jgi:hypothetical protein
LHLDYQQTEIQSQVGSFIVIVKESICICIITGIFSDDSLLFFETLIRMHIDKAYCLESPPSYEQRTYACQLTMLGERKAGIDAVHQAKETERPCTLELFFTRPFFLGVF